MSALSTTAEIAGIISGFVLPLGGVTVWLGKHWIDREIVSKLSNDDTPVAKYAHDARDAAQEAAATAQQALTVVLKTQEMLVEHVTDREVHRVG